jgi:transposase
MGNPCILTQIVLDNRHFSVIAAYTMAGFLCWNIIEGSVTAENFQIFLNTTLLPFIGETSMGLIDNATIHKTLGTLLTLNQVFGGHYMFSPAYSPDMKPIERGFADIKRWLREHEWEASRNPLLFINNAFELYSVNGIRGPIGTPCI